MPCYKLLTCPKRPENRRLTLISINKFNTGQTEANLVYEQSWFIIKMITPKFNTYNGHPSVPYSIIVNG